MIQVQILVGDLHKGHIGSDDVIRSHQQVFANNSRLKIATAMGVAQCANSKNHNISEGRRAIFEYNRFKNFQKFCVKVQIDLKHAYL